jgi:tetratricopeptide (TPR) repeat protein
MIGEQIISPLRGWKLIRTCQPWADAHGCILSPLRGWRFAVFGLAVFAALLAFAKLGAGQEGIVPPRQPSELAVKVGELFKAKKLDDAVALVRTKAAEPMPDAEVPLLMFRVAQGLYGEEKYEPSLTLLKEITTRFPDVPATSLAWCGMGQVYGRLGKTDEMIAALERGMRAQAAWTEMDVMDAGDTHGYACQVLGKHYVKQKQWDKALEVYAAWKPRSWCGTCRQLMHETRTQRIYSCLIQLGRFDESARRSWQGIAVGNWEDEQLGDFMLVKSYADSGQLPELQILADQFLENAREQLAEHAEEDDQARRLQTIEQRIASLSKSIKLAKSARFSDHIAVIQTSSDSMQRLVATWVLVREPKRSLQTLWKASYESSEAGASLTRILASIDSPNADSALKALARQAKPERKELIARLLHSRAKPADQGRPAARKDDPYNGWPAEFFAPWPQLEKGSLPTELPADLFVEDRR